MLIHVYTGDLRSFGNSPELWGGETIPVEVPDDFQGGAKTYNPDADEWVDDPAPPVNHVAESESVRAELLERANAITADWRTELSLGIIDDDDKAKLTTWMQYIKAVKALDTSTAPDIAWPEQPTV